MWVTHLFLIWDWGITDSALKLNLFCVTFSFNNKLEHWARTHTHFC